MDALPPLPDSPWPPGGPSPEDEIKYRIQGALSDVSRVLSDAESWAIVQAAFLGEGIDHHLVWYVSEPQPEIEAKIEKWLASKALPSSLIRLVLVPYSREELDAMIDEAYAVATRIVDDYDIPEDMDINVHMNECTGELKWVSNQSERMREFLEGTAYEDAEIITQPSLAYILREVASCEASR